MSSVVDVLVVRIRPIAAVNFDSKFDDTDGWNNLIIYGVEKPSEVEHTHIYNPHKIPREFEATYRAILRKEQEFLLSLKSEILLFKDPSHVRESIIVSAVKLRLAQIAEGIAQEIFDLIKPINPEEARTTYIYWLNAYVAVLYHEAFDNVAGMENASLDSEQALDPKTRPQRLGAYFPIWQNFLFRAADNWLDTINILASINTTETDSARKSLTEGVQNTIDQIYDKLGIIGQRSKAEPSVSGEFMHAFSQVLTLGTSWSGLAAPPTSRTDRQNAASSSELSNKKTM